MKKILPIVIVAAVVIVILCTASAVSASVSLRVTPNSQVTCPQTSAYWLSSNRNYTYEHDLLDDKAVTYVVNVETDCSPVSVIILPENTPIRWFINWYPTMTKKLDSPNIVGIWELDLRVPLRLGKDAGGLYTFTVLALDSCGGSEEVDLELVVQDHDYVSETMMYEGTNTIFTLDKRYRNMAIATSVDKDIQFNGSIVYFEENEYEILNARGNNANFQQESIIEEFNGRLTGNETLKSCAPLGGTGVTLSESYDVTWMGMRYESLGQYITGEQRYKTEISTFNQFNGTFSLDARQTVPTSRHRREHQTVTGNLTYSRHIIYRLP